MGKNLLLILVPVPLFTFLPLVAQCRASLCLHQPYLPLVWWKWWPLATNTKPGMLQVAAKLQLPVEYRDLPGSKDWLLGKAQNWFYTSAQSSEIKNLIFFASRYSSCSIFLLLEAKEKHEKTPSFVLHPLSFVLINLGVWLNTSGQFFGLTVAYLSSAVGWWNINHPH